jgi:hypothetical protein
VLASDFTQEAETPATDRARVHKLVDEQSGQQENHMPHPNAVRESETPAVDWARVSRTRSHQTLQGENQSNAADVLRESEFPLLKGFVCNNRMFHGNQV